MQCHKYCLDSRTLWFSSEKEIEFIELVDKSLFNKLSEKNKRNPKLKWFDTALESLIKKRQHSWKLSQIYAFHQILFLLWTWPSLFLFVTWFLLCSISMIVYWRIFWPEKKRISWWQMKKLEVSHKIKKKITLPKLKKNLFLLRQIHFNQHLIALMLPYQEQHFSPCENRDP